MLQPVELDLVEGCQQHPQLSRGKSLLLEPRDIMFRQVAQDTILVFAEGHPDRHELQEDFRIEHTFYFTASQDIFPRIRKYIFPRSPRKPRASPMKKHRLAALNAILFAVLFPVGAVAAA